MQGKRITLVFSLLIAATPCALLAQTADEYKAKAAQATSKGQYDQAAEFYCKAAELDQSMLGTCNAARREADKQLAKFEEALAAGQDLVKQGKFDEARAKFRSVKFGPLKDQAQDWLNNKVAAAEQQARSSQQAAENAQRQEVDDARHMADGLNAFENGDFTSAKASFRNVLASRKGEAQGWLNKIAQYEQAMSDGQQAEAQKNYDLAKQKYGMAVSIKGNGPGNPSGKVSAIDTLLRQTQEANNRQNPPRQIEQPKQPKLDIAKSMRDAKRASATGDTRGARKTYLQVLQVEAGNSEALSALEELNKKAGSTEIDAMLADGIRAFYGGAYSDAEESLKFYLLSKGSKVGLAKFYRGATKLTRYYLDPKPDNALYDDAMQEFKDAKRVSGFTPPDPKYISPKILKVYEQASL